jgi:hypothetical protein
MLRCYDFYFIIRKQNRVNQEQEYSHVFIQESLLINYWNFKFVS